MSPRPAICLFRIVAFFLAASFVSAAEAATSVTLAWNPNSEPEVVGYHLYYGTTASPYTSVVDVSTAKATVTDLTAGNTYVFAVTAYNSAGMESPFSNAVSLTVNADGTVVPPQPQGLVNISSRSFVQSGENVMIGGFIITGTTPKTVVIRALGPSLAKAGVQQAMPDPALQIIDATGGLVAANSSWNMPGEEVSAFGLAPDDVRECAVVASLAPGGYTAVVTGENGSSGIALVEVYDVDPANASVANISTRGAVGTGDDVMIGGFILGGTKSTHVIVRAIGPSLASAGVTGALLDPVLDLYDSNGTLISSNDNWRSNQEQQIIASTIPPSDDREAAIDATLAPGSYSAIVRGTNDSTGVALVEVYSLGSN